MLKVLDFQKLSKISNLKRSGGELGAKKLFQRQMFLCEIAQCENFHFSGDFCSDRQIFYFGRRDLALGSNSMSLTFS